MRKLIMWNVITLDGCFEGEKKWDLGFHQLVWGKELEDMSHEQLQSADMLVFGRTTYEGMADYWTNIADDSNEGDVAMYMNTLPKVVCSHTLQVANWNNTVISKDVAADIAKFKQQGDGNMFVFGSGNLSQSLMQAGLFDEYRLCIAPVFLGNGKPLFHHGIPHSKLTLLEARPLTTGGVVLRYAAGRISK